MITPYYSDLSQYKNQKQFVPELFKDILNIGWISSEYDFPTGEVKPTLLIKIKDLLCTQGGVNVTFSRGISRCPVCNKIVEIPREGISTLQLGISEIWIPYEGKIFASPDMIFHHISDHMYKPPQIFERAILAFDAESSWDGQEFFTTLSKSNKK